MVSGSAAPATGVVDSGASANFESGAGETVNASAEGGESVPSVAPIEAEPAR